MFCRSFAPILPRPFPYRHNASADFGDPKFGQSQDCEHFIGRRVDLLGRSLIVSPHQSPTDTLRRYLYSSKTASARALAKKALVLVYQNAQLARVVWPPEKPLRSLETQIKGQPPVRD